MCPLFADDLNSLPSTSHAQSLRLLPVNYAPETEYTVDSAAAADAQHFRLHSSVSFWAQHHTRINARNFAYEGPSQEARWVLTRAHGITLGQWEY